MSKIPKGSPRVVIYTDGSFKNNYNTGGYAALLVYGYEYKLIYEGEYNTTNNRQEIKAVINALKCLDKPCKVTIITDSQYVQGIINGWIKKWKKKNFMTNSTTPIANKDLIMELDTLLQIHKVKAIWCRAHTGRQDRTSLGNAVCDWAAQYASDQAYANLK